MKRPFAIVAITAAPSTALRISPRPPKRLVPPITAAEIASSSSVPPPWSRSTRADVRREHDAAEAGHRAGDHEDEDPDARDVDAGAPRRLGVAADGVDVAAERRALRDERPDEQERR